MLSFAALRLELTRPREAEALAFALLLERRMASRAAAVGCLRGCMACGAGEEDCVGLTSSRALMSKPGGKSEASYGGVATDGEIATAIAASELLLSCGWWSGEVLLSRGCSSDSAF